MAFFGQAGRLKRTMSGSFINQYRREIIICLLLITLVALVYGQLARHDFIDFDDPEYIVANSHVNTGLKPENILWAFTAAHSNNWHPITWISHMIDVQLFGLAAGKHHLVNVFFHIINSILLFLLLRHMTSALWPAAFAAALFALHPLHVESVAWASERKDVLSAFFFIVTVFLYTRYAAKPGMRRYLPVLFSFGFGLMSKQMLVTLPFVLLLLDIWPLRRISFRSEEPVFDQGGKKRKSAEKKIGVADHSGNMSKSETLILFRNLAIEKIPLLILAIAACVIVILVQTKSGTVKSLDYIALPVRLGNALVSYISYLGQMIWPIHLSVFYPHPESLLPLWKAGGASILLIVITGGAVYNYRRRPYLLVGWFWYVGTLVPVIGLVQVGVQAMADRYTYIPLIGIFIMLAWGLPDLLGRWRYSRKFLTALAAIILVILSILTSRQAGYWRTNIDLYRHAISVTDNNYWAFNNLGAAIGLKGDLDGAAALFAQSLSTHPHYPSAIKNMAIAVYQKGDYKRALEYLQRVVRKTPEDIEVQYLLAVCYEKTADPHSAASHYREVLRLNPADTDSSQGLQRVLEKEEISHRHAK